MVYECAPAGAGVNWGVGIVGNSRKSKEMKSMKWELSTISMAQEGDSPPEDRTRKK